MRINRLIVAVCMSVCGHAHAESTTSDAPSRLQISGTPAGGTYTVGILTAEAPITVQTNAGDTPNVILGRLAAAAKTQYAATSLYSSFQATADGTSLKINCLPGMLYARTTDAGIAITGQVTNLHAVSSKANGTVTLTWTLPNPAPDVIYIMRDTDLPVRLVGNLTTYVDSNTTDRDRIITYRVTCGTNLNVYGDSLQPSDQSTVKTDKPSSMVDDVFKVETRTITPAQNGVGYMSTLLKNGGADPVVWTLGAGSLPSGVNITPDGSLAGTPTVAGTFNFTAKVTDATGASVTQNLSITANP